MLCASLYDLFTCSLPALRMEARFSIQLALVILEQSLVTILLHSFVHVRLDRRLQSFEEMPIVLPADSIWQVDEEGSGRSVATSGAANIGGEAD